MQPNDKPNPALAEITRAFEDLASRVRSGEPVDWDEFRNSHPSLREAELGDPSESFLGALFAKYGAEHGEDPGPSSDADPPYTVESPPIDNPTVESGTLHFPGSVRLPGQSDADGADAASGEVLVPGRFESRGEIARGGMGAILEAWDVDLRRPVAMKIVLDATGSPVDPASGVDPRAISRFLEEAQITGQLSHPGIVPVHEIGCDAQGRLYFTMPLVRGHDLRTVIRWIRDGHEDWSLTRGLSLIQRICESMAYAHSKGVVHRDLKPANIMIGAFGEVYVMDWGLAKVASTSVEDAALDEADRLHTDRADESSRTPSSPLLTQQGSIVGTPSYMAPEQAEGRVEDLDARTDIYAVGAILYTMATGRLPYVGPEENPSALAVVERVKAGPPTPLLEVERRIPAEVVSICEKAMARRPQDRYATMEEFGSDVRAMLERRVVRAHQTGALAELRKWIDRNRAVASLIAIGLVATLASFAAFSVYREKQFARVLRYADFKRTLDFRDRAMELFPSTPEMVPAMDAWLAEADDVMSRLPEYRQALERDDWTPEERSRLEALVAALDELESPEPSVRLYHDVKKRRAFAAEVRERSLASPEAQAAWRQCIEEVRSLDIYQGLELTPQLGLVPLGRDPDSGLWEFWHLESGTRPQSSGGEQPSAWAIEPGTGMVFVLIPGGEFLMGRVPPLPPLLVGPNIDPRSTPKTMPLDRISLAPFFLSKYEMTQGQWLRFTGSNPSNYQDRELGRGTYTGFGDTFVVETFRFELDHPLEMVSWEDAELELGRMGLELPTEAQWEYATRAGTATIWFTGDRRESLRGHANLADMALLAYQPEFPKAKEWPGFFDGWPLHAPVGSYRPNPWGLHDMSGNVQEWCRDWIEYYSFPTEVGDGLRVGEGAKFRAVRGGGCLSRAEGLAVGLRGSLAPAGRKWSLGIRPARPLRSGP